MGLDPPAFPLVLEPLEQTPRPLFSVILQFVLEREKSLKKNNNKMCPWKI